ncbi:SpoIIE family protein phosphatase [Flavilitoribacter nigricans]|nr:SpoIIE family protein phosphatase [Flavilitoribacter nigricans]
MAKCQLFNDFTTEEIQLILQASTVRKLSAGEVLIDYGCSNDTLYLLVEGKISIVLEKDGTQISIPIEVGECLGEMSLVLGLPTSAYARAEQASRVLCISESSFWSHIAMTQKGVRNLMSIMAGRLRRSNHSLMKELEDQLKYQHLQKEIANAGKIQASIVPDGDKLLLNRPAVDAYALINQARVVGGDFYDALMLDDENLYIAIGDVSGKGMPAALLMMRTFTSLRLLAGNNPGFRQVIPSVNRMLANNNDNMMFVTIFAGVLHLRTGVLRFVNGGHNPPYISLNRGDFQLMDLPGGTLVGIDPDAEFPISELQLHPGDALVLYTDGITEAMNAERKMFGTSHLGRVLNRRPHASMKDLVQFLEQEVENFVGNAPQHDDFTVLGLQYRGPSK